MNRCEFANLRRRVQSGVSVFVLFAGVLPSAAAATDYVPTVLAVHEKYVEYATPEEIEDTRNIYWRSGIYSTTSDQIRASSCDVNVKANLVVWSDADIIKFGNDRKSELKNDQTMHRLEVLKANQKLPSSTVKSNVSGPTLANPWSAYSSEPELLNLIKGYALLHENLAPATYTLSQLASVQLPMVVIMIPSPGLYDPKTAGLKGKVSGRTTRGNSRNFVVLAYAAVIPLPKGIQGIITDTLPHEIAHYLGVPHVFAKQSDLDDSKHPDIQHAAALMHTGPDCGHSEQYASPPTIKDVDYLKSQQEIGDTLPMWIEIDSGRYIDRAACRTAYKDVAINDPAMRPSANLMHYLRQYKLLTPMQLSRAHKVLAEMQQLSAPANLCTLPH